MASTDNEYKKYLALVVQNRIMFVTLAVCICTVGVVVAYLMPARYEARSTVFIEKSVINDLVEGLAVTQSIEGRLKVLTHMLSSRNLLNKVIEDLDVDLIDRSENVSSLIRNFQKNTTVTIKGDDLFTIQYVDPNPRLARDYVNVLIQKYIEEHLADSRKESYGANRFLMEQMEHFRTRIQEAETRVTDFTQSENYAVLNDEALLVQQIGELERNLDEIDIRRQELLAKAKLLNRGSEKGGTAPENLADLQRRRDQLLLFYTENYPEVKLINAEIEQIQKLAKNAPGEQKRTTVASAATLEGSMVGIEVAALDSKVAQLRREREEKKAVLATLPEKQKIYNDLLRDRDTYKRTYEQLVQRYGKSELTKQMEIQDKVDTFRIVDPAVLPDKPANPNRVPILLFGLIGGIAAGFGLLLARDYFDDSVRSIDAVQGIGLPVLALIPQFITAEERLRRRRQAVALTAFVAVYLLGYTLILTYEVLQVLDLPILDDLLRGFRSSPQVALAELVRNLLV